MLNSQGFQNIIDKYLDSSTTIHCNEKNLLEELIINKQLNFSNVFQILMDICQIKSYKISTKEDESIFHHKIFTLSEQLLQQNYLSQKDFQYISRNFCKKINIKSSYF
jgi:hypothetical protein